MKLFFLLALFAGSLIIGCTKQQPQPQQTNIDNVNTGDSIVSGTAGVTPDTGDNTLPMDSASYDVDSIKNSK
ncbi:hypothetical protein [Chryseobacterium ginsenosidimutans]|uniref:hypothetical protein n=1 Tax=Chryseobacterium ginsenosidimutans TaxID=687846 RepID=UPI0027B983FD|nr:hypothetical protein [Chryseobacterium ginsenosidimutans]